MKRSTVTRGIVSTLLAALPAIVLATSNIQSRSNVASAANPQQVTQTSTSTIVVIAVPGFPIESIFLGIIAGLAVLSVIRRFRPGNKIAFNKTSELTDSRGGGSF